MQPWFMNIMPIDFYSVLSLRLKFPAGKARLRQAYACAGVWAAVISVGEQASSA
jgi:hypothetical protein